MERYSFTAEKQLMLESLPQPLAVYQYVDSRVVTLAVSDGFCELFGYKDRALAYDDMDNDMYKYDHPDDVERISAAAVRFATEDGSYDVIYRTGNRFGDGYRVVHAMGKHVREDGVRLAYVWYTDEGIYAEETDDRETDFSRSLNNALREESILKVSRYDALTELPNMARYFELAEAGKEGLFRKGRSCVFMYLDLNGMKYFNTKYGFSEGDKLLRSFAGLLTENFGSENCCHVGAGHFAVFTTEEGLEDQLSRLFADNKHLNDGNSLPVRVGIYSASAEDEVPVSRACDRAKIACDSLRKTYYSGFAHYNSSLRDDIENRQYVLSHLDRAISEQWIKVYYQPIVRAVNGRVCGEEALARWIDPEKGMLSPADFIPYLEDAGVIYKLDLYVVDQVLEKIRLHEKLGLNVVSHSINLSRADFDACDIVEEIRRRVDKAGVAHNRITIELTESIIGRDFDFMKEQVDRFRRLGFPVWMDDFGSGYSSLDMLQSIHMDLLKFDMSFLQKLDEGENAKIILTELMKMAAALGVDTICEGTETQEQVRFLREIGCSKLQGYYYSRAIPSDDIIERYQKDRLIGYENPEEAAYFEAIGRVNLYDLAVIANEEDRELNQFYSILPMGIIEVRGDKARFARSNPSYREFIKRLVGLDLSFEGSAFAPYNDGFMNNVVKICCEQGQRAFYDERMPDGSVVHSFARRVGVNPVSGTTAVVVAVLSITDPEEA